VPQPGDGVRRPEHFALRATLDVNSRSVAPKRIEQQIDDALLATAMGAGFLYVRRRARRLLSHAAIAATVTAGLGALGTAGLVAIWQRNRTQRS